MYYAQTYNGGRTYLSVLVPSGIKSADGQTFPSFKIVTPQNGLPEIVQRPKTPVREISLKDVEALLAGKKRKAHSELPSFSTGDRAALLALVKWLQAMDLRDARTPAWTAKQAEAIDAELTQFQNLGFLNGELGKYLLAGTQVFKENPSRDLPAMILPAQLSTYLCQCELVVWWDDEENSLFPALFTQSLLAACVCRMLLDMHSPRQMTTCRRRACQAPFLSKRINDFYCTKACGFADRQAKWRANKKSAGEGAKA